MKKVKRKKKIDMQAEGEGKHLAPVGIKEKKLDLTDEIKIFLKIDITLERIKHILLRLNGPFPLEHANKASIKIFLFINFHSRYQFKYYDLLIYVKDGEFVRKYYVNNSECYQLSMFSKEKINTSELKSKLFFTIYKWCLEHRELLKVIEVF